MLDTPVQVCVSGTGTALPAHLGPTSEGNTSVFCIRGKVHHFAFLDSVHGCRHKPTFWAGGDSNSMTKNGCGWALLEPKNPRMWRKVNSCSTENQNSLSISCNCSSVRCCSLRCAFWSCVNQDGNVTQLLTPVYHENKEEKEGTKLTQSLAEQGHNCAHLPRRIQ